MESCRLCRYFCNTYEAHVSVSISFCMYRFQKRVTVVRAVEGNL